MLQLYTYVIDITSKPLFFVHFVDDVDLNVTFQVFLFSLVGLKCCGFLFFFLICIMSGEETKLQNKKFLESFFVTFIPLSARQHICMQPFVLSENNSLLRS